ncbi:acylphosphatase [Evansella sp. LMS18]|uniref:acylphosphatase n=1 Tax=Evansella sp. LMS18 TaxID=2924033 RepID=UPI0020D0EE5B|nr:acylphosphatase [Evansella sp. LMS18]UTR11807.1 acylphosphatase [Evansella sp. LMS18]
MEQNNAEWLPHLTSEVVADARGPELDAYAVALEGWRRGLILKWHVKDSEKFSEMKTWFDDKPGKLFSLSSGSKTHYFFRTRGDKVTNEAVEIGGDKVKTKVRLTKAGISVPEGKSFSEGAQRVDDIVKYASSIGYPVVLKPGNGSFGRGVFTNIKDEEGLVRALIYYRNNEEFKQEEIIAEQYIPGKDYRIYVVNDQVAGAINRIPAHVTGDGTSSIENLIRNKNEDRAQNPRLVSCLISIDKELEDFLSKSGYTVDSIPPEGERIYLTEKSNISIGGDPIDVLDELSEDIKDIAIKAMKAIPGLSHGSVDIITDSRKSEKDGAVVLEVNPTSQIGAILFPLKGKARDIPSAIIDYYFPETIGIETDKERIYFDFPDMLEPLLTRSATTSTVSHTPVGKIYAKKYTVSGDVQGIDYHRGLRKQAFERKLSGFVTNLDTGDIEVVVAGTDQDSVDDFKTALTDDPERSTVNNIHEEVYNAPIKVGFEVKGDLKTSLEELRRINQRMEVLKRELKVATTQYRSYERNIFWQATWPVRKVADITKSLVRLIKG